MSLWGFVVSSTLAKKIVLQQSDMFQLNQTSLSENSKQRSVVTISHDGTSVVVCNLVPGKVETWVSDISLYGPREVYIHCTAGSVEVLGYAMSDENGPDGKPRRPTLIDVPVAAQAPAKRPAEATKEQPAAKKQKQEATPAANGTAPAAAQPQTPTAQKTKKQKKAEAQTPPAAQATAATTPNSEAAPSAATPTTVGTAEASEGKKKKKKNKKNKNAEAAQQDGAAPAAAPAAGEAKVEAAKPQPQAAKADNKAQKPKPAEGDAKPKAEEKKPEEKKAEKKADGKPAKKMLKGGLAFVDLKEGNGAVATSGKRVTVQYTGKLTKTGKVFDSNNKGFPFRLGVGEVIRGWDEGVVGMKVGGQRTLLIPAKLGYGATGAPPDIPPGADLTFDVKLLKVA